MSKAWKHLPCSADYPKDGNYSDLLAWHLFYWGTRHNGNTIINGKPWKEDEFRLAAFALNAQDTARTSLNNWLGVGSGPKADGGNGLVKKALFGTNPAFVGWARDLDDACGRSSDRRNTRTRRFPDPPPVLSAKASIPPQTPHFMGRDDERDALAKALASTDSSAILIQGGPGIGKTELAKAIANHPDVAAQFGNHRYFVSLETANSSIAMQDAIIRALGCDPQYGFQVALDILREKPSLLILDNLETPWESPGQCDAIDQALADLAAIPAVSILATFRGQEAVGGTRWLLHVVEELPWLDAIALFTSIAGPGAQKDPHIADFTEALGGIPLAIDLVARRAHGRATLASLWQEWLRIGAKLAVRPGLDAERTTSLALSIEFSLLSPRMTSAAWRLFRILGCLPAGLRENDIRALLGEDAFDAAESLCHVGLSMEEDDWVGMLPPIRDYARRRYVPEGEDAIRWVEHFTAKAAKLGDAEKVLTGDERIYAYISEFKNIESSFHEKISTSHNEYNEDAIVGLATLVSLGAIDTAIFTDLAEFYIDHGVDSGAARCLEAAAEKALFQLDYPTAERDFIRALEFYRSQKDAAGVARCLSGLGDVGVGCGFPDIASDYYKQSVELFDNIEDDISQAKPLTQLGEIAFKKGDFSSAREIFQMSQRKLQYAQGQFPALLAPNLMGLAEIALFMGEYTHAEQYYIEALSLYKTIGHLRGIAGATTRLGDVALSLGQIQTAHDIYQQALRFLRKIEHPLGLASCLQTFGSAALRLGDTQSAQAAFEEEIMICRQFRNLNGEACGISGLAEVSLALGDTEAARSGFEKAAHLYREDGWKLGEANCLRNLGEVFLKLEDGPSAKVAYENASALYQETGDGRSEAHCLSRAALLHGPR